MKKHKSLSIQRETMKLLSTASLKDAAGGITVPQLPADPSYKFPEGGSRYHHQCHDDSQSPRCMINE